MDTRESLFAADFRLFKSIIFSIRLDIKRISSVGSDTMRRNLGPLRAGGAEIMPLEVNASNVLSIPAFENVSVRETKPHSSAKAELVISSEVKVSNCIRGLDESVQPSLILFR